MIDVYEVKIISGVKYKPCVDCESWFPLDQFYDTTNWDKKGKRCKSCQAKYTIEQELIRKDDENYKEYRRLAHNLSQYKLANPDNLEEIEERIKEVKEAKRIYLANRITKEQKEKFLKELGNRDNEK